MRVLILGRRKRRYRNVQEAAAAALMLMRVYQRRRGTCPAAKIRRLVVAVAIEAVDTSHLETTTRIWY
jgi:hypothetical protein